jgi:hypothetical protein
MSIEAIGKSASVSSGASSASSYTTSSLTYAAPDAVATDLPPTQAVVASAKSTALPEDDTQQVQSRAKIIEEIKPNFIKNKVVTSDSTDEIVFLSVDERTGEVLNKFPSTAILGADAYSKISSASLSNAASTERVA